MADLEALTRIVRDHLRDRGFTVIPSILEIKSFPAEGEDVLTTVRVADRSQGWSQGYADGLKVALRDLPGSPYVKLSPIRDYIEVLWTYRP